MTVLVLNCGSSSVKHRLYDARDETELCRGAVEGVGSPSPVVRFGVAGHAASERNAPIRDHGEALATVCDDLIASGLVPAAGPERIAHRVVHGGERFSAAVVVDDDVLSEIERLTPLAPLHNPANLLGMRLARERFPAAEQVAVFDTAFHQTMPPHAARYALPRELASEHGVRRYGFHGSSHAWASQRAAELLGRPLAELKTVVLHLGAGASAAAVDGGRSIDTTMGMTPLEGLVMATRCGDLDAGVVLYLQRTVGLSVDEVDALLNRQSGLLGLSGTADLRETLRRADAGDLDARIAVDAYVYRIAKCVGAYAVAMGGLDALVFTAGVGERSAPIRSAVATRLTALGVRLDEAANATPSESDHAIQAADSAAAVLVIAANEELQIAREALAATGKQRRISVDRLC